MSFKKTIRFIGRQRAKASCISLYGPTGVGKTTLLLKVERTLIEQALPTLEIDRGRIPVVRVEAIAPESGNFNWKDYFTRSLIAMEEPLIDYKIDYGERGVHRNSKGEIVIEPKVSTPNLRRALENALKHRCPDAFLIDEAQHLQKISSGRRLQDNMDCIKSIANLTCVPHILIGTYELLMFRNLSGQLSRRTQDIHFPRYQAKNPKDMVAFRNTLYTFQCQLPIEEEPNLLTHLEYCYERSLGCVGILKEWLTRAFSDVLEEKSATLTLKHLEQRALSVAQCKKMLTDIKEGENKLEETPEDSNTLRTALGIGEEPSDLGKSTVKTSTNAGKKNSDSRKKTDVGKPNPTRRKVGVEEDVG
jgi:hypothetical protein